MPERTHCQPVEYCYTFVQNQVLDVTYHSTWALLTAHVKPSLFLFLDLLRIRMKARSITSRIVSI